MDVTDIFFGVTIMLLTAWAMFLQLGLGNVSNGVSGLAIEQAKQNILFSPQEFCAQKPGMTLVPENSLSGQEYIVTAGTKNGQKFLCFYKAA